MSTETSPEQLRILVLSNMYPPHHMGGYELSCRDVVNRWRANGHRVAVLTSDLKLDGAKGPDDETDVRRELRFYWDNFDILKPSLRQRLQIERSNQAKLREVMDEFRPHVISAWNMGAMSLGLLTAVGETMIPLVLVICDDWLIYAPLIDAWTHGFRRWPVPSSLTRKLFKVPTTFSPDQSTTTGCFISDTVLKRARTAKWAPTRATITYNGIDTADFPIREPGAKEWRWQLLYVGRVEERKGVGVAVEALAHLPEQATLTIDGPLDDSFATVLRARVKDLGLTDRVVMQNSKRAELAGVYAAADVLLFPVLWEEPFGLVPLEAMACATPVIATGTGGSGEFLVDGANCLIAKPGDVQFLASAVHRLAADEDLRRRLVEGGRHTARNLDVDEYARVLEAWHRAASIRFADGEPAPRPTLSEVLASLQES